MNKYQMFSAHFKNIKELQIFLTYANPLAVTTIPDTLGFAFITWCAIFEKTKTCSKKRTLNRKNPSHSRFSNLRR